MRQQLHLLHQRFQTTMIHVTHDQVEAMTLGDRVAVLDAGRVRQVGRPQALYDHPRDRFVAGFIGWPPMNFLPGTVSARENHLVFTQNGCSFPLPSRTLSGANGTDREAILGIRPEALRLQPAAPGAAWRIVRVEPLGGTCLVTLEKAGQSLVAQTEPGREWQTGQTVDVSWNMAQTHLFDRSTGMALATG